MKDDLISKQAAINAKQAFRNPNVIQDTESRTAYDRTYANGWNDCNKAWINAIEKLPPAQPNKGYIEQIKWERDMAIQQLKELGYGLDEKIRTDEDTISRRAAIEDLRTTDINKIWDIADVELWVNGLPSSQPDAVTASLEELINDYGEDGYFTVDGVDYQANELLNELKTNSSVGEKFRKQITKTIVAYFMKFGD